MIAYLMQLCKYIAIILFYNIFQYIKLKNKLRDIVLLLVFIARTRKDSPIELSLWKPLSLKPGIPF